MKIVADSLPLQKLWSVTPLDAHFSCEYAVSLAKFFEQQFPRTAEIWDNWLKKKT